MSTKYYSLSKSIPLIMGGETKVSPNSQPQLLASEKNGTYGHGHDLSSMGFNILVRRPVLEFGHNAYQIARSQGEDEGGVGRDQLQSSEEKQEDNFDMFVSSLKVKIPSVGECCRVKQDGIGGEGDVDDEGLKTPTSMDHKIISLECPPAPRKPKSLPLKKRKATNFQPRIILHLSSEIESLFPPVGGDLVTDLGGMIKKKVRLQGSDDHTN